MKVFSKTPLGRRSRTLVRMVALPRPGLLCEYSRTLYRFPSSSKVTPLRKSLTSITAFRSFPGDASHYNAPFGGPSPGVSVTRRWRIVCVQRDDDQPLPRLAGSVNDGVQVDEGPRPCSHPLPFAKQPCGP